jgi:hypothetical protein
MKLRGMRPLVAIGLKQSEPPERMLEMSPQALALPIPPANSSTASMAKAIAEFPEWFTLRGHAGVFRIDQIRSCRDGVIVVANVNGREVGRCSVCQLRENIYEPAYSSNEMPRNLAA